MRRRRAGGEMADLFAAADGNAEHVAAGGNADGTSPSLPVALIEIAVDPVDRSGRDHPNQRPVRLGNLCNGYANQFPILQPCDELRDIAAPEMSQPFRIEKFLIQIQKTPAGVIAALSEFFVIGGENLISFRIQQKVGSLIFFIFDLLNDRLNQFVIAQFEPDQSLFFA